MSAQSSRCVPVMRSSHRAWGWCRRLLHTVAEVTKGRLKLTRWKSPSLFDEFDHRPLESQGAEHLIDRRPGISAEVERRVHLAVANVVEDGKWTAGTRVPHA